MKKEEILDRIRNRLTLPRNILQLLSQAGHEIGRIAELSEKSAMGVEEMDGLIEEIKKGLDDETPHQ